MGTTTSTAQHTVFRVGEAVRGFCNGKWHSAVILGDNKDGTFTVSWNDLVPCAMIKHWDDLKRVSTASSFSNSHAFKLYAGPGFSFCNDGVIIDKQFSSGLVDCSSICMANSACVFYSQWHSGSVRWCRLTRSCDALTQQSNHLINIFKKETQTTTTLEALAASVPSSSTLVSSSASAGQFSATSS